MRTRVPIAILAVLMSAGCARGKSSSTNGEQSPGGPASASASVVGEIVYRSKNGTVLTPQDLAKATGEVKWEIRSQTPVSVEAQDLHQRGREAGASGNYDGALAHLARAAQLAPQWPYPVYDAAFTYLLKGDPENALRFYRRTVELAPRGFFTALTAVHYLTLESEGQLPKGTYLAYVSLEWVESPTERTKRVEALAASAPTFAPIWKEKATLSEAPAERLALLDRGLKQAPDPETRGFLLINKALSLSELGRKAEAVPILGELGADQSQPPDVQQIALATLANITSK
jgi:tetratricopeptide (TPR) repeat protein